MIHSLARSGANCTGGRFAPGPRVYRRKLLAGQNRDREGAEKSRCHMTAATRTSARPIRALAAWLLLAVPSIAQPPSTQPIQTVQQAAEIARQWVAQPARAERINAFSPAADIRYRVYDHPRPLRVWIARIDLTTPGLRFALTEPAEFAGDDARFETRCANTLEFAMQRGVQLAVNTSAFDPFRQQAGMPMDVIGLAAVRGGLYSAADERFGALYISRQGRIALKGPPLPADDVWHVIPGFRMLVDDGRIVVSEQAHNTKFGGLNPRTAAGTDKEGRTLWLVVVDGRQKGVSEGITLVELACLFQSLGVWDALNLDGGGSSTFVLENADGTYRVLNTPVGRGEPNTLREVANNLGLYLPGEGLAQQNRDRKGAAATLRDTVIRLASSRRGGGYALKAGGVSKDITYAGEVILRTSGEGTYCCGATLEAFLDAYCQLHHGCDASEATGNWFQEWPKDKFVALYKGWYGTEDAPTDPLLPEEVRPTIREKQVCLVLPWTGLAESVGDYRLLRRGDFVEFWRKNGTGHSVVFWARDRDDDGRERMWYWSSQKKPRYAYPPEPGAEPVALPGYGINWEYIGDEIDPARICGVSLIDNAPQ
jgi:hypothetical protein